MIVYSSMKRIYFIYLFHCLDCCSGFPACRMYHCPHLRQEYPQFLDTQIPEVSGDKLWINLHKHKHWHGYTPKTTDNYMNLRLQRWTLDSPSPLLPLPMQPPPWSRHPLCRPRSTACRTAPSQRRGSGTAACDERCRGAQSPVQPEVK